MGVIEDIRDIVEGWIDSAISYLKYTMLDLVGDVWTYASQISDDLWNETNKIWAEIEGFIVITKDMVLDWVEGALDDLKESIENLSNTLRENLSSLEAGINYTIDTIQSNISDLYRDVSNIESWITNAGNWFTNQLNNAKHSIIDMITDAFVGIVERVLDMEKEEK